MFIVLWVILIGISLGVVYYRNFIRDIKVIKVRPTIVETIKVSEDVKLLIEDFKINPDKWVLSRSTGGSIYHRYKFDREDSIRLRITDTSPGLNISEYGRYYVLWAVPPRPIPDLSIEDCEALRPMIDRIFEMDVIKKQNLLLQESSNFVTEINNRITKG